MNSKTKIILFGGTFDPIHNGHLAVAQHTLKTLQGSSFIFVPARQSPHKKQPPEDGRHRLEMIRCAVSHIDKMTYNDCELRRSEPSYTFDTIEYFRRQFGQHVQLYWLIGADQLEDLARWYRIEELLQECHISTMIRGGYPVPDMSRFKGTFNTGLIEKLQSDVLQTPEIPINSTYIRDQLKNGQIPYGMLPQCVAEYIIENKLYGLRKS